MIYLNGKPLNITYFPDNTSQVWKLPESAFQGKFAYIRWDFSSEAEFMHLAQLKHLLDNKLMPAYLKITYLPYGRQDKMVSNDNTFALRTFARMLDNLDFKHINIIDPHSSVILDYVRNTTAEYPTDQLEAAIEETRPDVLCYPDKGALEKYSEIYSYMNLPFIYGEKVRDQATGNITNYKMVGDPFGKNVLIVDDICDYGRTFINLTEQLVYFGAKKVNLFVTHGIFSGGIRVIKKSGISKIFTSRGEASEDTEGNIFYTNEV